MHIPAHFVLALEDALAIGIDVAKASLEICCIHAQGQSRIRIDNTAPAIQAWVDAVQAAGYQGMVVMESTGYYHWLVAVTAAQGGLDVRLVNPLMSSKHSRSAIRKTKTDPVDAYQLALMALTERKMPPRWQADKAWVVLRHKVGLLATMEKSLQRLQATIRDHQRALARMGVSDDPVLTGLQTQLAALKRQCAQAEKALTQELAQCTAPQVRQVLHSIPGISPYLAGLLGLFLRMDVPGIKSWIAFVGLDIGIKQSGTWVGRSKLSKRGNAYLRKRLYQAAWGAKQNNPEFRAYYEQLRAQGRGYVEALLIIARKLLRIAYALLTKGQMYRPEMIKT